MGPDGQLFGADRYVLYLDAAVESFSDLDGARVQAMRRQSEKFLDSPQSVFKANGWEHLGQIRDLDTNTRAFGTWCQNDALDVELLVVHTVYRKSNEGKYFAMHESYHSQGAEYAERFTEMEQSDFQEWKQNQRDEQGRILAPDQ